MGTVRVIGAVPEELFFFGARGGVLARILKWAAILGVFITIAICYVFLTAERAGWWVDHEFSELSQGWNPEVITRDGEYLPSKKDMESIQKTFSTLKQGRLEAVTPAECTYGPQMQIGGDDSGLRAQCVLWARFDLGVLRFNFELVGFWNRWKIAQIGVTPDDQHPVPSVGPKQDS